MQSVRVTLPGNQWAEIRTPDSLKRGDQRAVNAAVTVGLDKDAQLSIGVEDVMRAALIARLVTAWSFDLPTPASNPDVLDDLGLDTYNALVDATEEHWSRVDFKRKASSTTSNSSDSKPSSPASNSHPVSDSAPTPSTH